MKPIDLVLDAIRAGSTAKTQDAREAYLDLTTAIRDHLKDKDKKNLGEMLVGQYEQEPSDMWGRPLAAVFTETGAAKDERIVGAALKILGLVNLGAPG